LMVMDLEGNKIFAQRTRGSDLQAHSFLSLIIFLWEICLYATSKYQIYENATSKLIVSIMPL
jgi:hypothetical protein